MHIFPVKSRSPHSRRVSRGQKLLLAAPVLAVAAPASQAEIIFTNVNGGSGLAVNLASQGIFFSLAGGTYRVGTTHGVGDQFELYFTQNNLTKPAAAILNVYPGGMLSSASYGAKLNAGTLIGSGSIFYGNVLMADAGNGPWGHGGNGYLGLKISGNYGWANIAYAFDNSLTLYGFAYQNDGSAIHAGDTGTGAVPEPAETAMVAALVAGSAVALAARRKRKLARAA